MNILKGFGDRAMLRMAKSFKPHFDKILSTMAKDGQVLILTAGNQFITSVDNVNFVDVKKLEKFDITDILNNPEKYGANIEPGDEFDQLEEQDEMALTDEDEDE